MNDKRYLFRGFYPDENVKTTIMLNGEKIKGQWLYWNEFGILTVTPINPISGTISISRYAPYILYETVGQWVATDKNGKDAFVGDKAIDSFGTVYILCYDCANAHYYWDGQHTTRAIGENMMNLIGNVWEVKE